jgi:hypothetical protein
VSLTGGACERPHSLIFLSPWEPFSSVLLPRWEEEVEEGDDPLPLPGEDRGEGE